MTIDQKTIDEVRDVAEHQRHKYRLSVLEEKLIADLEDSSEMISEFAEFEVVKVEANEDYTEGKLTISLTFNSPEGEPTLFHCY